MLHPASSCFGSTIGDFSYSIRSPAILAEMRLGLDAAESEDQADGSHTASGMPAEAFLRLLLRVDEQRL